MGCTLEPNERDEKMIEGSTRGENCLSDAKLIEEVESEIENIAKKELGLQKEEIGNRKLVEERIRQRFIHKTAQEDGIDLHLISQELSEKVEQYKEINLEHTERAEIAEKVGVEGIEKLCELMGYQPYLRDSQKTFPQSFDSVWKDPKTNKIVIVESKTFKSKRKMGYGAKQGTLRWAYGAARRMLYSKKSSKIERETAKMILKELEKGNCRMETIRLNEKEIKIEKEEVVKFSDIKRM
jgi:hypothetical protein